MSLAETPLSRLCCRVCGGRSHSMTGTDSDSVGTQSHSEPTSSGCAEHGDTRRSWAKSWTRTHTLGTATAVAAVLAAIAINLLTAPSCGADGLGCEGYQIYLRDDPGFIFEKSIGLHDFLTVNISEYCTEFTYPGSVPEENMELPPWWKEPRTYIWTCKVRDASINTRLSSLFPLEVKVRGCGQGENRHFEFNPPPPASCVSQLSTSDNVYHITIQIFGERIKQERLEWPHSWVWFCDVHNQASSIPLERGDTFTLEIQANDSVSAFKPFSSVPTLVLAMLVGMLGVVFRDDLGVV